MEIALIHRPDRDDWSLPKGKLDKGESFEQGALREVREETGYECRLAGFVGTTEYVDAKGRPKVVAYWVMEPAAGVSFADRPSPDTAEVDELRWLDLPAAGKLLSYDHDRELLASLPEDPLSQTS